MRVEHYDQDQQKVLVLMKDAVAPPEPLPDPSDFAACLAYWTRKLERLDMSIKKMPKSSERQTAIAARDSAKAQVNKYKHLAPRTQPLNVELPDASS